MRIKVNIELQLGVVFHVIRLCLGSLFINYRHHPVIPARLSQPYMAKQDIPVIVCVVLCSQDQACVAINHQKEQNTCEFVNKTGYFQKYDQNITEGWNVYNNVKVDTMYKECKRDKDCLVPNSRCMGFCYCQPLFEYLDSDRSCVKVCNGYGATFTKHDAFGIKHHTLYSIDNLTEEECKQNCLAHGDSCQTAEFRKNGACHGKAVTIQEAMKTGSITTLPTALYNRNCEN